VTARTAVICAIAALIGGCGGSPAPDRPSPFVLSGSDAPATVWAIGDAGHIGERERTVAKLIGDARPDRLLYLGDVYETGTAEEFEVYDQLYGRLASVTAPTPGNHEWPAHAEGYDPYWASKKGQTPPSQYSFRLAGWEIIGLNSQLFGDAEDEQASWLRRKVAAPGTCRLAFWHEPRYSAGTKEGAGDEPTVEPLWSAVEGRVALVVNAHDHNMQRMKPRDGIVQLISGSGGHNSTYPVDASDERLAFADDEHDGALSIRLSPGRAQLAFVATGGEVLDSSTVSCNEGG